MESASTSRTGSGRGRMGVPSLEDITCSQLARKLRDPKSVLFGEELPGVLNANLPEDDELRKKRRSSKRALCPAHFPCLESLEIADSPRLSDKGLLLGPRLFPKDSLRSLVLRNCPLLTWRGIQALPDAPNLEFVNTVSGSIIPTCEELLPVDNSRCTLKLQGSGNGFDALVQGLKQALRSKDASKATLTELAVNHYSKADDDLAAACAHVEALQSLALSFCHVTKRGLDSLRFMSSLQVLDLSYCAMRFVEGDESDYPSFWSHLTSLKLLDLSGADFGTDPSQVLYAIHAGCPSLEGFTARSCKLKDISGAALIEIYGKLRKLDLSGNKRLGDSLFVLPYDQVSMVESLNVSGTKIINPVPLVRGQHNWPLLKNLQMDYAELAPAFLVEFLTSDDAESIPLQSLSLQHCKTITNRVLEELCRAGGIRTNVAQLDITAGSFSHKIAERLASGLRSKNPSLVFLPELHDEARGKSPSPDLVSNEQELYLEGHNNGGDGALGTHDDDNDGASVTSESSIESQVMRRFVRTVEDALGTEKPPSLGSSSVDHSTPEDEVSEAEEHDFEFERDLIDACCHCSACVLTHPGRIIFQKKRYSKDDLYGIRGKMNLSSMPAA